MIYKLMRFFSRQADIGCEEGGWVNLLRRLLFYTHKIISINNNVKATEVPSYNSESIRARVKCCEHYTFYIYRISNDTYYYKLSDLYHGSVRSVV